MQLLMRLKCELKSVYISIKEHALQQQDLTRIIFILLPHIRGQKKNHFLSSKQSCTDPRQPSPLSEKPFGNMTKRLSSLKSWLAGSVGLGEAGMFILLCRYGVYMGEAWKWKSHSGSVAAGRSRAWILCLFENFKSKKAKSHVFINYSRHCRFGSSCTLPKISRSVRQISLHKFLYMKNFKCILK